MPYKHEAVGSSPTAPTKGCLGGEVAQLVEQWTENPRVDGSIPSLATRVSVQKCVFGSVKKSSIQAKKSPLNWGLMF